MIKTVQYGHIEMNGKQKVLKVHNQKRLLADIQDFPLCEIELTIKKRGKRTNQANRYYRGVIVMEIVHDFKSRGIQMDAEQVHEFLKLHFNKKYIHSDDGEVIGEYGGSTADMSKPEFNEYLDSIIQWCAEKLSLIIPPPNTQTELFNTAA